MANLDEDCMEHVTDGWHTFGELYRHRHELFCSLMLSHPKISWRAEKHNDGTRYDDAFIAGMHLPTGDITYHLPNCYWDRLDRLHTHEIAPPWDGHTSEDVLNRLCAWGGGSGIKHKNPK